ncbi:MAG: DUF177 domain-containing protein [Winogradskyella sp.]|nr:DUF177 domain-containing protein [Winogradskyella sp.]NNK40640.1 DUF177 domain-containing protein [Winogradskyella sp.]NNL82120.1 DUF177 domain-containing protein [Winogradskyella sp.]
MKALKTYIIPFVGLKLGKHQFDYQIDNTFFECFEYEEFNDVNIDLHLNLEKKSTLLELNFMAEGTVNVNCDITNEPFGLHIKDEFDLVVKFGSEFNNENDEILILPHGEYEINVAQYIYELIILAIPAKKVHPGVEDGTLKSDILDRLNELNPNTEKEKTDEDIDPRWNNLKKLLTDK